MEPDYRGDSWLDELLELTEEELIRAPHYMKANIIRKSRMPVGQVIPMTKKERKRRLFIYSLKVAAASAALIAMIFLPSMTGMQTGVSEPSIDQTQIMEEQQEKDSLLNDISASTNDICDALLQFTQRLTNWEVFKYEHEQKEK